MLVYWRVIVWFRTSTGNHGAFTSKINIGLFGDRFYLRTLGSVLCSGREKGARPANEGARTGSGGANWQQET